MPSLASNAELLAFQAGEGGLALDLASAAVISYCGWPILETADDTVTVVGYHDRIWLPTMFLSAVTAQDSNEDPIEIIRWDSFGLVEAPLIDAAVVTFTHGYTVVPDVVKLAVLSASQRFLTNPQGIRSEALGVYQVGYTIPATGEVIGLLLADNEKDLLTPYRIPPGP